MMMFNIIVNTDINTTPCVNAFNHTQISQNISAHFKLFSIIQMHDENSLIQIAYPLQTTQSNIAYISTLKFAFKISQDIRFLQ